MAISSASSCSRLSSDGAIRPESLRRLRRLLCRERIVPNATNRALGDVSHVRRLGERPQLLEALVLDLADALTRHVECAADLVECPRLLAVEAVAQLEHTPLALREAAEDRTQRLAPQRRLRLLLGQGRRLVGEEVPELRLLLVAHRLLERDGRLRAPPDVLDLVHGELEVGGDLPGLRLARELRAQFPLGAVDL